MPTDVLEQTAVRISEHVKTHGLAGIDIVFHGGEPLLLGARRLDAFISHLKASIPCQVGIGLQTNATLFSSQILDTLSRHQVQVGISVDGPEDAHDRHRVDHKGRGTHSRVIEALRLASSRDAWSPLIGNYLAVVDLGTPPARLYEYFSGLGARSIDLILPDRHHDAPPSRPLHRGRRTAYGDWLADFFDLWYEAQGPMSLRLFEEIIVAMLGGVSTHESIAAKSVDLVVVETDGAIEPVDTLKVVGRQATHIGLNVFENSFDEALSHPAIRSRMSGYSALCDQCQSCPEVRHCGGGYLPHRWGRENGFLNPSVYCADLTQLFARIRGRIMTALATARSS